MRFDDLLLPGSEDDGTPVLLARAVLGKESGPVPVVAGHRHAALLANGVHANTGSYLRNDLAALLDKSGPRVRAHDTEVVTASRVGADAAIAEIEAEKVGIRAFIGGWSRIRWRHARQWL
ncbi:hypothetical protein SSP24_17770 [Streptomyces spinoverrucosus]|uniref:Uncharacterized protein n=1 Tax=Streptomyces spinoverrucosus TaxID=284043 RepID=A0A4Y3VAD3_9ACTN|nr:hypothetical protein SSP24_17770 [Streptomyces spinoverrucosus]GHB46303.1 hypothetical protein GCM10010397_15230 [Streptomyces spinoverrucosus]